MPVNFARDLVRGQYAAIADPGGRERSGGVLHRACRPSRSWRQSALKDDLVGPLASRANKPAFTAVIQRRYNPEGITQYNIVPGLIAVILTMTMVMVTAMAMTRERETRHVRESARHAGAARSR